VTDPVTSVSVLAVVGAFTNLMTLVAGGRRPEVLGGEAAWLVAWALPGLALGTWLVTRLPSDAIRVAVGVLVFAALLQRSAWWAGRSGRLSDVVAGSGPASHPAGRGARAAAGVASGALSTSTGLSGPPLVLYFTSAQLAPRLVRDTLAAIFLALGVLTTTTLAVSGELTLPAVTALLPFAAIAGAVLGHRIFDRLPSGGHARIVTALLVASALVALGSALG
jgi:uncharacterized membrane protein YfcA